jgi:hypothetical protein
MGQDIGMRRIGGESDSLLREEVVGVYWFFPFPIGNKKGKRSEGS